MGAEEQLGRAGRVGELVGTAAVAGPAIVAGGVRSAAAQALTRQPVANLTGALITDPGIKGRIVQDIAAAAIKSPAKFATGELAAATGAGLASFETAQRFPNSPGAQAMAEIAGGFGPALVVPVATGAARLAVSVFEIFPV